ncbi:holdfast anchor protein HfaD [Hyphomonas sp. FCG-A18]|uniref:holdfast anchor protein HfaD n=1 Tax=Hyphomonas sp. FCG-A18 TaxID=3080019 RepID=UPI002B2E5A62|nr:holdfast anchor protein HfaD [Hyphomonas sp. FCG-A18]
MLKTSLKLLGAAATVALLTSPALADEDGEYQAPLSIVVIDQVQLNDVWSDMEVEIPGYAADAVSTSTAVGNAAAGLVTSGDIDLDVYQTLNANVGAENRITGYAAGTVVGTTTAYGNSTTGGTWAGDNYYRADQVSNGDVSASTTSDIEGAYQIATSTTAIANVSVPSDEYGTNRAFQYQESNGSVIAETDVEMCCDGKSATFTTTAGANAVSSTGLTSTNFNGAVQIAAEGETVQSYSDVYMNDGHDVLVASTGFGNSATVHNQYGYATLGRDGSELYQQNGTDVDAQTYVTLDHWSGYASATAYGVGNSALISNSVSDTGLFANQDNSGQVYSQAQFNGQSTVEGTGIVSATSIGNAATATLCNTCGDAVLQGGVNQINSGQVIARGQAYVTNSGGVYGSATAVGNSATFQSTGH